MTVDELVQKLLVFPGDMDVCVSDSFYGDAIEIGRVAQVDDFVCIEGE